MRSCPDTCIDLAKGGCNSAVVLNLLSTFYSLAWVKIKEQYKIYTLGILKLSPHIESQLIKELGAKGSIIYSM